MVREQVVPQVPKEFLLPYLTLMRIDAPPRSHDIRESFNVIRYVVKTGCQWDILPNHLPEWQVAYQQARRWSSRGSATTCG